MARLIWTEPALQDLDEIADYIALDNSDAAKQLVQDVFSKVESLKKHPKLGKPVPELGESIYRELFVTACRIFYRIENDAVIIIHILRVERLLRKEILTSR